MTFSDSISYNFANRNVSTMLQNQFVGFLETYPLWINEQFGIRQFEFPEVDITNFIPMPISERLRLGHRMEHVFNQLITVSSPYHILIHNLTIQKNKRSIGEIDFILQHSKTKHLVHVELTYKFYIIDTYISEPVHQLIGPNRRDMFFTKLKKITQAQFPLLHTPEGKSALKEYNIDHETIEHQCCFKGQLFIPYGQSKIYIRPLNKKCIQGFWLKFDAFNTEEFKRFTYYIPHKFQWVEKPNTDVFWQSHYEVVMELNLRMMAENAPMVWMRRSEFEIEKFFVVWW